MPSATPWPDDGDAAFLAALEAPRPKPKPLAGVYGAACAALEEYRKAYYYAPPVEIRMRDSTARRMLVELGLEGRVDSFDGAQLLGLVVAIDDTLEDGEVRIGPTPDEWAVTQFVNDTPATRPHTDH